MRIRLGPVLAATILCLLSNPADAAWIPDPGHGYAELEYSSPMRTGSLENTYWHLYGEQGLNAKNALLYQFSRYQFSDNSDPFGSAKGWGDYKLGIRHQTFKTGNRSDSLEIEYLRPIAFQKYPASQTYLSNPQLEIRYDWGWGFKSHFGYGYRQIRFGYRFVDGDGDQLQYKLAQGLPIAPGTKFLLALEGYRSINGNVFDHWVKIGVDTKLCTNSTIYVNRFIETSKNTPKGHGWQIGFTTTY